MFRRFLWRFGGVLLAGYILIVVLMMIFETGMVYPAPKYPIGDWQPTQFEFEDALFQADDGVELHGWYFAQEEAEYHILYFHGNGENVAYNGPLGEFLRQHLGASLLMFDYRGYGKSDGKPNERGLLADSRAARKWLADRENIPPEEVILMGRSLGGGPATQLAVDDGARALLLQSTFTSLPDLAAIHYPWLPVRLVMRNRFDTLSIIEQYEGPLFMSHSVDDEVIPYQFGKKLFDEATAAEPSQFFEIHHIGHNEPQPDAYYSALKQFLDNLPRLTRAG